MVFMFHHDTIYPIGFIQEDCVVLCETIRSSLNNPYLQRLFHTLEIFFRQHKNTLSLRFDSTIIYLNMNKIGEGGLGYFTC